MYPIGAEPFPTPPQARALFKSVDVNGDRRIDVAELRELLYPGSKNSTNRKQRQRQKQSAAKAIPRQAQLQVRTEETPKHGDAAKRTQVKSWHRPVQTSQPRQAEQEVATPSGHGGNEFFVPFNSAAQIQGGAVRQRDHVHNNQEQEEETRRRNKQFGLGSDDDKDDDFAAAFSPSGGVRSWARAGQRSDSAQHSHAREQRAPREPPRKIVPARGADQQRSRATGHRRSAVPGMGPTPRARRQQEAQARTKPERKKRKKKKWKAPPPIELAATQE